MNKYEWIEAVMASKVSHATKTFAFGLFKHMDKTGMCFPGDEALMAVTGMGRGHFSEYRRNLIDGGWVDVEVRKTKNGDSYYYRIPQTATNGEQNATNGEQTATNGEQNATNGGRNTVNNTTNNPVSNPVEATVPDGPVVTFLPNYVVKEEAVVVPLTTRDAGPAYAGVYKTEDDLRERRARVLGR